MWLLVTTSTYTVSEVELNPRTSTSMQRSSAKSKRKLSPAQKEKLRATRERYGLGEYRKSKRKLTIVSGVGKIPGLPIPFSPLSAIDAGAVKPVARADASKAPAVVDT